LVLFGARDDDRYFAAPGFLSDDRADWSRRQQRHIVITVAAVGGGVLVSRTMLRGAKGRPEANPPRI
jgi:hypothetical protein